MIIDEKKLAATGCMITRPVFFWPVTVCTRSCNLRSISCLDAIQYIVGLEIILVHGFVTLVTAVAYHFCLQHSRNHIQVLFLGPVETIYTLARCCPAILMGRGIDPPRQQLLTILQYLIVIEISPNGGIYLTWTECI